jgi:hypothetical protein
MTAERGTADDRITRDDIESKFRELQGEVGEVTDDVRSYAATAGVVVVVVVIVAAFWLGRTKGRRTRTVVEIRRF